MSHRRAIGGGLGRGVAAVCFLVLLAVALLVPAGAAAATGSISGTVTDATTAEPIAGVEVCAWSVSEEEGFDCDDTDATGAYALAGLAAAEYKVEFWPGGLSYVTQFYDGKANWSEADVVTVGTGAVTGIDAALARSGAIEGTVMAASGGAPVGEAEVCAFLVSGGEESVVRCDETGSDGKYTLPRLAAGDYKLEIWPWEGNFVPQFYDRKYVWSEADLVSVAAGETKGGVDVALEAGAEISGTVLEGASGAPLARIRVCSIEASSGELWSCDRTDGAGHYGLRRLPGGQFKVGFSIEFREFFVEEEESEEDDGYMTQFFNGQPTLAAAATLAIAPSQLVTGVDARLTMTPRVPIVAPPATVGPRPKPKCRKGRHPKRVHGKWHCVRNKKPRHENKHRHHSGGQSAPHRPGELARLFAR